MILQFLPHKIETERKHSFQANFPFFFDSVLIYEQTNKESSLSASLVNTNRLVSEMYHAVSRWQKQTQSNTHKKGLQKGNKQRDGTVLGANNLKRMVMGYVQGVSQENAEQTKLKVKECISFQLLGLNQRKQSKNNTLKREVKIE